MTLLKIDDLSVEYTADDAAVHAVNDVSFDIEEGERFGLVGESGSGKTTIAKAIMRLLPKNGRVTDGTIELSNESLTEDLVTASERDLQTIRWDHLSIISQSAMNALDPVYTIGDQIVEAIRLHESVSKADAKRRAGELLERVGIDEERVDSYPHQLSGGMRQRAMIAMSMALDPSLIIADEPTTALDVITQDHILDQIDQLSEDVGNSLLMITHDISVVAETCDRVGVMYGGELVEVGPTEEVFTEPEHPYTQGLLNAFPTLEGESDSELITITGEPPNLSNLQLGCNFADRCPYAEERCRESNPALTRREPDWNAACFVTEDGVDIEDQYEQVVKESEKWQAL
jgi:oligopeptide/dipeptide ABC transporter ATP-binding protein